MNGWTAMPKLFVLDESWSKLYSSTMAILPLIYRFRNKKTGICYPKHETLARLTGLARPTISEAVEHLPDFISHRNVWVKGPRRATIFTTSKGDLPKGDAIFIKNELFDNGLWSELTLSAKNLYVCLRASSSFDISDGEQPREFKNRTNEVVECEEFMEGIRAMSGIKDDRTIKSAIDNLKDHGLLEEDSSPLDPNASIFKIGVLQKPYH